MRTQAEAEAARVKGECVLRQLEKKLGRQVQGSANSRKTRDRIAKVRRKIHGALEDIRRHEEGSDGT